MDADSHQSQKLPICQEGVAHPRTVVQVNKAVQLFRTQTPLH